MLLNWKEINLILEELNLEGSLIQQVYQPEHPVILFQLYKARSLYTLFFSLSPAFCRLHTTKKKFVNPKRPQRFVSFLRAHIRGGRIVKAYQVDNDRIVKLQVKKREKNLTIWVRLWGGAANMIVTDEHGHILDACYRRPGRNEISSGSYNPEKKVIQNKDPVKKERKYTIRNLGGTGSFNEKVEEYFRTKEETINKQKLIESLTIAMNEKEVYLLSALEKKGKQKEEYIYNQRFKELGDLIMSSLHSIKKSDKWLIINDFYNKNQKIEIELNPDLSPQENAEQYYEKYKTAKSQVIRIEKTENRLLRNLEEIKKKRKLLNISSDLTMLLALKKTFVRKNKNKPVTRIPGLHFISKGFPIIVGRTATENDQLLRNHVRGNDYWFHSRDYPGSYIFVKATGGKSVPLQVMLDAGNLAIFYSKGKEAGQGDVYYTQVKYLRRAKKGKKGKVIPTQEKNLYIVLDVKRIENLKNSS